MIYPARRPRLAGLVTACLVTAASCAPRDPAPPPPAEEVEAVEAPAIAPAEPQQLMLDMPQFPNCPGDRREQDAKVIGPATDSLVLPQAGHRLIVPAGAVEQPTRFMLRETGDPNHIRVIAQAQRQGKFRHRVHLILNTERCEVGPGTPLRIVRQRGPRWEDLGSRPIPGTRRLIAELDTLSVFAVSF